MLTIESMPKYQSRPSQVRVQVYHIDAPIAMMGAQDGTQDNQVSNAQGLTRTAQVQVHIREDSEINSYLGMTIPDDFLDTVLRGMVSNNNGEPLQPKRCDLQIDGDNC